MKKFFCLLIFFFVFVTGCYTQKEVYNLSFEQAKNIFSENINYFLYNIKAASEYQNYNIVCSFSGEDELIDFDMETNISGFVNNKDSLDNIGLDIYFFDKAKKNKLDLSGFINKIYVGKSSFLKLSDFVVDAGTGYYETNLWYKLIENLGDKWINYEPTLENNVKFLGRDLSFIINSLVNFSNVFQERGQVTYEGNTAYKIVISDEILDTIQRQTNIKVDDFEGLLVIKSDNDVDMKINNMNVFYLDGGITRNVKITGIVGSEQGFLIFSNGDEDIEISFELHKKYTKINIVKISNSEKQWDVEFLITSVWKNNSKKYKIKGNLLFLSKAIYGSELENDMKININCSYENFDGNVFDIKEPDSFLLLDQILGDEFSIKSIFN